MWYSQSEQPNLNNTTNTNDDRNLNPDVPEFVPDFLGTTNNTNKLPSNSKNSEATRLQQTNANELQSSGTNQSNSTDNDEISTELTDDQSELWREVKRRSRTSSKSNDGAKLPATTNRTNENTNTIASTASNQIFANAQVQQQSAQPASAAFEKQTPQPSAIEKEDLDFQFDEELDMPIVGRANNFTENWSDDESDYELSDRDINKILIVTQVRHRVPKHDGYNRTGDFTSRTKISQDLEQVINDGLHNYEEDLWTHDATQPNSYKTLNIITQEDFERMAPRVNKKTNRDIPPPPPPTYNNDNDSSHLLNTSNVSGFGSKKARFFAASKEEFVDPRTPRKRKTRHLYNPPVESHVGWVRYFPRFYFYFFFFHFQC